MSTPPAVPLRSCPKCGGKSYLLDRRGELASAQLCDCRRSCPQCEGRGHIYVTREETFSAKVGKRTYEVMAPCTCQLLRRRVAGFEQARIPGVLAKASFESFRPQSEAQNHALQVAQSFALGYRRDSGARGFVLSGPVGTGKTHLICSALSHLVLERGVMARYIEISLLYADIRRGFNENKSGGEIIAPLSEVEVLAIDELGKGRGSQFELDTLDELIARRYNAGRTTLFATNYSLESERKSVRPATGYRNAAEEAKNAAKDSELLRERVGERIYSRLCEMCEFVELPLQTQDYRRFIADRARGRMGA